MSGPGQSGARPLRLLFIADPASLHVRRWLAFFAGRGHEVALTFDERASSGTDLDPRVRVLPFRTSRGGGMGRDLLGTRAELRRVVATAGPEVLHAHGVSWYGFGAWLSGFHPYVVTPWGSDVMVAIPASLRRRVMARLALRSADLVTGGSEHLIDVAVATGARRSRTRFIHFGVDTGRFTPGPDPTALRRRLDLEGRRVLLANRTIAAHYRPTVIVEALARLPEDTVVLMTRHHPEPDELERVERRARELGISERVRFLPEVGEEEMPDLYRLADAVISIPRTDGGPITLVEGLASGRPIVATDLPAVREWLGDLDPGALVPVDDVAATAGAVRRILERDPAQAAELARLGREEVVTRADFRRNMEAMEVLYLDLAAGRRMG